MKILSIFIGCFLVYSCSNLGDENYLIEQRKGEEATLIEFNQEFKNQEALNLNSYAIKHVRNRNFSEAHTLFLEALELEPSNHVILNNLGLVEMEFGEFKKAEDYFRQSFAASKYKYIQSVANLAFAHFHIGDYNTAIKMSKVVLERKPTPATALSAYLTLSLSYAVSGECTKAEENLSILEKLSEERQGFNEQLQNLKEEIRNCKQHTISTSYF